MKVADVMSRSTVFASPDASFKSLWRSIIKNKINSVPVVDKNKKLLGIVTRENLLEKLYPDYSDLFASELEVPDFEDMETKILELSGLKAQDVMSKRVIYTHEETPVMRALSRMIVRRVNQLPVLSDKGALIGVVTKGDIFSSMFRTHMGKGAKKKQHVPVDKKKI